MRERKRNGSTYIVGVSLERKKEIKRKYTVRVLYRIARLKRKKFTELGIGGDHERRKSETSAPLLEKEEKKEEERRDRTFIGDTIKEGKYERKYFIWKMNSSSMSSPTPDAKLKHILIHYFYAKTDRLNNKI